MRQQIEQRNELRLSRQMIQSLQVLQMDMQQLGEYVNEAAESNPVLELTPAQADNTQPLGELREKYLWLRNQDEQNHYLYKMEAENGDEQYELPDKNGREESLYVSLMSQLSAHSAGKKQEALLRYIVLSLDENGYLPESADEIARITGYSAEETAAAIRTIQSCEPAGVGAGSLSQCLCLQLERLDGGDIAYKIASDLLPELSRHQYRQMASRLNCTEKQVKEAWALIKTLEPRPGSNFSDKESLRYIVPDVLIERTDDELNVSVNNSFIPEIRISDYYIKLSESTDDLITKEYLSNMIQSASYVMKCVAQRQDTLYRCALEISKIQHGFFFEGKPLKPMTLKSVAEATGLHISTVSRAINGKYVQTPMGARPIKALFSGELEHKDSDGVSSAEVKKLIADLVSSENKTKPLSDNDISAKLEQYGVKLSRRAVAYYRSELDIPSTIYRRNTD